METLIIDNANKKDIQLLIDIAAKIGINVKVAPKKKLSDEEIEERIMQLSKKVNKAAAQKAFAELGYEI